MSDIGLDYVVPAPELAPFITVYYWFRADIPLLDETERADHAQFRFRLSGGAAAYHFADGSERDAPPIHVLSATNGAIRTVAAGPVRVFGMGLTPAGWEALLGADASMLANQVIDAEAAFGPCVGMAAAALAAAATPREQAIAIEPLMLALMDGEHGSTVSFVAAVDAWLADAPSPDLDDLCATTGLSRRQTERRCNALYGAPPKLLARKYRALRAAAAIAAGEADVDSLIADGFYDQSHLIREIKQFTGHTPRRIREHPDLLTSMTLHQRRALGDSVPPIVSRT